MSPFFPSVEIKTVNQSPCLKYLVVAKNIYGSLPNKKSAKRFASTPALTRICRVRFRNFTNVPFKRFE